MFCTDFWKIL